MIAGLPLPALVGALVVAAALVSAFYRRWPRAAAGCAVLVSAVLFVVFASQLGAISRGETIASSFPWAPSLDVAASFRIDGLASMFALLITGIGTLVLAYTPSYMEGKRETGRLLGLLLAFEASMLGLVLADDSITLFVFWELTSISSFFLIAFDDRQAEVQAKARQALIVTSAGGLVLLAGLLLLAGAASPSGGVGVALSTVAATSLAEHAHYSAIVVLIAIGAFTKSAQVPFHFWLPGAMVAPSPVSAYLHSATMVNAGIYLLARLHPALGGTALWVGLLCATGAVTMVVGALVGLVQRDVKLTLAYATVAILGALTLLLGIGTATAISAALVLLVAHALYKATLFLVAGNLYHHRDTRDPLAPEHAVRDMPVTAATAVLASLSMAGVPPLLGFIAKDALLASTLDGPWLVVVTAGAFVAGAALVTCALLAGIGPFVLRGRGAWQWHDVPPAMLVGPVVLAACGLLLGPLSGYLLEPLVAPAAAVIAGRPFEVHVELWPGLGGVHGIAFGLGLASILLGWFVYRGIVRGHERIAALRRSLERVSAAQVYERVLAGLQRGTEGVARTVQHGHLPGYVAVVIGAAVVVSAVPLLTQRAFGAGSLALPVGYYELPLAVICAASATAAALFRDRLSSVAALGVTGLAMTFLFAMFSAPDLAITQLTVETMMVILLVLVFRRLPHVTPRVHTQRRALRLGIAAAGGALVTAMLLVATSTSSFTRDAAAAYSQLAPGEEFTNVVNAIIVDFRAIDTLGEIAVLAVAGLGVLALVGAHARTGRS